MGFSDPPKCQTFADKLLSKLINQDTEDEDNGTLSNVFMQRYAQEAVCSLGGYLLEFLVHFKITYGLLEKYLGPSGYYRLPDEMLPYLKYSVFLPFLNNEVQHSDYEMYKTRIRGLNSFVAVEWDSDTVIYPRSSELFDQISPKKGEIVKYDPVYREMDGRSPPKNYNKKLWENNDSEIDSQKLGELERFKKPYVQKP